MKKTMTPKQLAANRRNAQKSTGPRTQAGKLAASMNPLKHALLAETAVVCGQRYRESGREFKKLCQEFYADHAPQGATEEMLVEEIVLATWRLRRARLAEAGEITLSVDEAYWKRNRVSPESFWALWEALGDPVRAMRESAVGNAVLAGWLREVRQQVEKEGELTEEAIRIPFQGKPNELSADLAKVGQAVLSSPQVKDEPGHRAEMKNQVLAHIDREVEKLEWSQKSCDERDKTEDVARQMAAVMPTQETLEKILRYEAALERQLFRAMNPLERLQRRRQGENVPAPLTLELTSKG